MAALSPARLDRARKDYFVFNALNAVAFVLISGSFITLFALRLGASKAFVGLLNAMGYLTFFFLPLGKRLARGRPLVSIFAKAWLARYLSMIPALAAPLLAAAGAPGAAFGLILASVALFNIFRGIGLIGNNPLLAFLASGGAVGRSDTGAFIVTIQIIVSLGGLGMNLAVALLLGKNASPALFAAAMAVGVAVGASSCILLFKAPEPEAFRPPEEGSLLKSWREAFSEKSLRSYLLIFGALSFIAGMARSFLPVYAKEVFAQGDDAVMAYSLVGSLGGLAMGLLTRLLVDRLGAKPLYVIFTAVAALSLAPLALAPGATGALAGSLAATAFLVAVNFASSFGFAGEENAAQTYFFALSKPERTMDLGVIYFLVFGIGGSLGAGAGGVALDFLEAAGMAPDLAYRAFYGFAFAALVLVLATMSSLKRLGSASVRESLGVMLSIRDLRSFDLLARLDKSADPAEETALIAEIGARARGPRAASRAQRELLGYLASPRFDVRIEALLAIEKLPRLEDATLDTLIAEVEKHPYTTAYVAARILGKARCARAAAALRAATATPDYMLQGSAIVALARLSGPVASSARADASARVKGRLEEARAEAEGSERARIEGARENAALAEQLLERSPNPRVLTSAAYALELMGSAASIPALVACMRRENPPPFVCDELVLSTATILGLMPRFYAMYQAFLKDEADGLARLDDAASESFAARRKARPAPRDRGAEAENAEWTSAERASPDRDGGATREGEAFVAALTALLEEPSDGVPMARIIFAGVDPAVDMVLAEAALDPGLGYRGFRFLVAAYAALKRPPGALRGTA